MKKTGITTGPQALTVNVAVTVNDPNRNSNNKSDRCQVQNTSGFTLSCLASGEFWTIPAWWTATIPVRDGNDLVMTPKAQNASGIGDQVTEVWLMPHEDPPIGDGSLATPASHTITGNVNATITSPVDDSGNVKVAVQGNTPAFAAPSNANSAGNVTSLQVKNAAGTLYGASGYSSIAQYFQLLNATAISSGVTVPAVVVYIPTAGSWSLDFEPLGRSFGTGIYAAYSSTETVFTTGTAGWIDAQFT